MTHTRDARRSVTARAGARRRARGGACRFGHDRERRRQDGLALPAGAVKPDPCTPGLSTTVYSPTLRTGAGRRIRRRSSKPTFDCFYVYPTVSRPEDRRLSNLHIDPEEQSRSRSTRRRATRSTAACSPRCTGR